MKNLNYLRPNIYEYESVNIFLKEILKYHKLNSSFSLRKRTSLLKGCSQSLISHILNGKRQVTRDNLNFVAEVFKLTKNEIEFIDAKISAQKSRFSKDHYKYYQLENKTPNNHILSNWLNPYVKDLITLKGFKLDSEIISKMLGDIATNTQIKAAIQFLLFEGFWKKNISGEVILNDNVVTTTNGLTNLKIQNFHKKALELAMQGLKKYSVQERKASTVLIAVDNENIDELNGLIDSFQNQLIKFIEKYPDGQDSLVQITAHLTPVGRAKC